MPELPAFLAGRFERLFGRPCAVTEVETLAPRFRRIRFAGQALEGLRWRPGQDVEFLVGAREFRHYTPSWFDVETGAMDIIFHLHGPHAAWNASREQDGVKIGCPGSAWAEALTVGDDISMMGPAGDYGVTDGEAWSLFLGDETTVSLFAALIAARSQSKADGVNGAGGIPVLGAVEIEREDATEAMAGLLPGLELLPRDGAARGERLAAWARAADLPVGHGAAYVVGHAQTVQRLRRILLDERRFDRRLVRARAFWADDKRGL